MSYRLATQRFVSMTIATLAGAVLCGLFTMVLFVTGALAG